MSDSQPEKRSTSTSETRKKRSPIWYHFKHTPDSLQAECTHCSRLLCFTKTSSSNLIRHLRRVHPNISIPVIFANAEDSMEDDDNEEAEIETNVLDTKDTEYLIEQPQETQQVFLHQEELDEDLDRSSPITDQPLKPPPRKKLASKTPTVQHNKPTELYNASLDRFGLYVASMMKMLPPDVAARYQKQIIDKLITESHKYMSQ